MTELAEELLPADTGIFLKFSLSNVKEVGGGMFDFLLRVDWDGLSSESWESLEEGDGSWLALVTRENRDCLIASSLTLMLLPSSTA